MSKSGRDTMLGDFRAIENREPTTPIEDIAWRAIVMDGAAAIESEARREALLAVRKRVEGLPAFRDRDDMPWPYVSVMAVLAAIDDELRLRRLTSIDQREGTG